MTQRPSGQRRGFPRIRRRLPITVGNFKLFTHDISAGGFCVELQSPLAIGTQVRGAVNVGAESLEYTGHVAWAYAGDRRLLIRARVGICLTGVDSRFYALYAQLAG